MEQEPQPCPQCGSVLDPDDTEGLCARCVVAGILAPLGLEDGDEPGDSELGQIGGYEVLEKIAAGGMGVVYRARQKGLDRIVALKLIIEGRLAGQRDIDRFLLEARSAAKLDHPNIVPIHDVGEDSGQPYFSMRYVEGGSLVDWCEELHGAGNRRGTGFREGQASAVKMMIKVAGAVEYAHSKGILHRDLKPSNILVDEIGEPHITDFGLAKQMGSESQLTLSGQLMGSPAFIAPEQVKGLEASPSSDIYSLGVILYQLLTGGVPFEGETPLEVIHKAANEAPPPPSDHGCKIDRDLEVICLKCLEKEPADRFSSAANLADDLGRWLEGEPIEARPLPSWKRCMRWCQRNRGKVAAFLIPSLCFLVIAVVLSFKQAERDEEVTSELYATHVDIARGRIEASDWTAARASLQKARQHLPAGIEPIELRFLETQLRSPALHSGQLPFREISGILPIPDPANPRDPVNGTVLLMVVTRKGELVAWDVNEGRPLRQSTFAPSPPLPTFNGNGERLLTRTRSGQLEVMGGAKPLSNVSEHRFMAHSSTGHAWTNGGNGDAVVGSSTHTKGSTRFELNLSGPINALAIKERFLALMYANHLEVWDISDEPPEREVWVDHSYSSANALAFSRDGRRLATGGTDGMVRIWGPRTGNLEDTLPLGDKEVAAVAFYRSKKTEASQKIAAVDVDGNLKIWDALQREEDGRPVPHLTGPLAVSEDARYLIAVRPSEQCLSLLDLGSKGYDETKTMPKRELLAAAFDGPEIVALVRNHENIGIEQGPVELHRRGNTSRPIKTFPDFAGWPGTCAITPGGSHLLLLSGTNLQIFETRLGERARQIDGMDDGDQILAVSRESVVIGDAATGVRVLSLNDSFRTNLPDSTGTRTARFSRDGHKLALVDEDSLTVFTRSANAWRKRNTVGVSRPGPVAWSADDWTLIIADAGTRTLGFYNAESGRKLYELPKRGNWKELLCTPDGSRLVAASTERLEVFSTRRH